VIFPTSQKWTPRCSILWYT